MNRKLPTIALAAAILGTSLTLGVSAQDNASSSSATSAQNPKYTATGITEPSKSVKVGFDVRGVVGKVAVKRNDRVKIGQPLISLQDEEARAELEMYRLRADTSLAVAEAEQTFAVKKIDYEKKKHLYENKESPGTASEFEVRTAEAEMNIAQIRIDQARHDAAVNQAQANAQQARVDKMHKLSPIDGEVRDVVVKEGEQVDESKPVIEIVDLDPLYVEVKLMDTSVVQKLKLGQTVQVKYADESRWRDAVVNSIDPSADARTTTHPFRLELPNPEARHAGLRVDIRLPAEVAAAAAAVKN